MPVTVTASAAARGTPGFRRPVPRPAAGRGASFPGRARGFRCGPVNGRVFMGPGPGPCGPGGKPITPQDVNSWLEKVWGLEFDTDGFNAAPSSQQRGSRKMFVDVTEGKDSFRILADLPGVAKSDIKLHVDGNSLTISVPAPAPATDKAADADDAPAEDKETYLTRERCAAFAERTVKLPDAADMSDVQAKLDMGVLTISVPKTDEAVKARRSVPIE